MQSSAEVTCELIVKIEGKSLQSIDDGLINFVGERLQARINQKIRVNGEDILQTHGAQAIQAVQGQEVKKRGRQPGPVGPYKVGHTKTAQQEASNAAPQPAVEPTPAVDSTLAAPVEAPFSDPFGAPTPPDVSPVSENQTQSVDKATKEDAIRAISGVNSRFDIDKARECLAAFKVARVSELKEEQFSPFVTYCENLK